MTTKIILDVDTGTDDAVALMTAALSPDIELVGATVVNGNTVLDSCVENTLRVFEWIGMPEVPGVPRHVPPARPRRRPVQLNPATRIHGDKLDLPEATIRAQAQHAVDWLIDTYLASDGDITLVPVGPLTNIATAIQKEPRILERIPEIVIMGGAHDHGNSTASAEFNIWLDPEAARIVVNCGRPIRMVPLDATHRALVSLEDAERLRALGTPAGEAAYRFISKRIEGYDATQPMHRAGAAPVHDALAVCAVIDPAVITTHFTPVDVETGGELSVGRTVCDFRFRGRRPANVHFAMDARRAQVRVDADRDPGPHGVVAATAGRCVTTHRSPRRLTPNGSVDRFEWPQHLAPAGRRLGTRQHGGSGRRRHDDHRFALRRCATQVGGFGPPAGRDGQPTRGPRSTGAVGVTRERGRPGRALHAPLRATPPSARIAGRGPPGGAGRPSP